ncbi:methyltransferase domain-containing protein [Patescibacteria group bacterium]|nr:methyltransferase domain-containing protein [Patescibacteria group bacterium]MDE1946439.1 methyltransferase domain-containing protein [Patescibacteria group bacterium]
MSFFNNFHLLAKPYQGTDQKPDKHYSILPTVLKLVGDPRGKAVLDVACGSGFFSFPIAAMGATRVIGIDNSEQQLEIARCNSVANTEFHLCDIFDGELPSADIAVIPFAANYSKDLRMLAELFARLFRCLNQDGHAVFVMDLPGERGGLPYKRMRSFGAVKWWAQGPYDGAMFCNHLFDGRGKEICSLWAYYYSPLTIQFALQDAGFRDIRWHKPVVSDEGLRTLGQEFWQGYQDNCELGYITAEK